MDLLWCAYSKLVCFRGRSFISPTVRLALPLDIFVTVSSGSRSYKMKERVYENCLYRLLSSTFGGHDDISSGHLSGTTDIAKV